MRRHGDEEEADYRSSRAEGSAERWVKWSVLVVMPVVGWLFLQNISLGIEITRIKTTQDIFTTTRLELDQRQSAQLQRLIDQHQTMTDLMSRMIAVMERQDPVGKGGPYPVFPRGSRFDK